MENAQFRIIILDSSKLVSGSTTNVFSTVKRGQIDLIVVDGGPGELDLDDTELKTKIREMNEGVANLLTYAAKADISVLDVTAYPDDFAESLSNANDSSE